MQNHNIVIVDDHFRQYRNYLSKALTQLGAAVTVIAPFNPGDEEALKSAHWLPPLRRSNVCLNIKPARLLHHALLVSRNIRKREQIIKVINPDIIHMQGISFPLIEPFFSRSHHALKVITIHNINPHEKSLSNHRRILQRIYRLENFDAYILHSKGTRDLFLDTFPCAQEKVYVIPHGCPPPVTTDAQDARRSLSLPSSKQPILLFFGNIRKYKGLDILLKCLTTVKNAFPDILLVVAGRMPYDSRKRYERIIALRHLSSNVSMRIGYVPERDVNLYFRAADVLALPYTHFNSQSGVLMKAYANQCPVVVSDLGAMGEVVKKDDTGLVVKPKDERELAAAIIRMLSDGPRIMKVKKNMQRCSLYEYNWIRIAKKTLALYSELQSRK